MTIVCFFLLGPNSQSACSTRPYLFNIAYTLAVSPLLIKSWRVHQIFNLNPMARKSLISNYVLFLWTLGFIFIDIVILIANLYSTGQDGTHPVTLTRLSSNGAYAEVTYCGYYDNYSLMYCEVAYKGLLIFAACVLSFLTRNVVDAIAGSKTLLVIIYNTAVVSSVMVLVVSGLTDIRVIIFCESLGICFCVVSNGLAQVLPWLYQIIYIGDKEAAVQAIDALNNHRSSHSNKSRPPNFSACSAVSPASMVAVSPRSFVWNEPTHSDVSLRNTPHIPHLFAEEVTKAFQED